MKLTTTRSWLLISSIVAAVATGITSTLLITAGLSPTPWLVVPMLTFIAVQTSAVSLRLTRQEAVRGALAEAEPVADPIDAVPTTMPDGTLL